MPIGSRLVVWNAAALYARTAIVALLALFTSRVVYGTLGKVDFGLMALMASVVGLMAFVNAAMAVSAQRHLGIEIGRARPDTVQRTFNAAFAVHAAWALLLLILAETIGLWFVKNILQIPPDREAAAFLVYQCTVITAMGYVIAVPYTALMMAHEALAWSAGLDVIRATLVFAAALILPHVSADQLIFYSAATAGISVSITLAQALTCRAFYRHEAKIKWTWLWDLAAIRQLAGFSGWTLFGAGAFIGRLQGTGVLLNLFFGVAVNAAYGICVQVNTQVSQLTQGVLQASSPRVLLLTGSGKHHEAIGFCLRASKYAGFLAGLCVIPVLFELPTILIWWLKNPPPETATFCRIMLAGFFLDQLSFGLGTLALALGRLARYQVLVGSVQLLGLPLAYLALKSGLPAAHAIAASVIALVAAATLRPWIVGRTADFPWTRWLLEVLGPVTTSLLPAAAVGLAIHYWLEPGTLRTLILIPTSIIAGLAGMYTLGMTPGERQAWRNFCQPHRLIPEPD